MLKRIDKPYPAVPPDSAEAEQELLELIQPVPHGEEAAGQERYLQLADEALGISQKKRWKG